MSYKTDLTLNWNTYTLHSVKDVYSPRHHITFDIMLQCLDGHILKNIQRHTPKLYLADLILYWRSKIFIVWMIFIRLALTSNLTDLSLCWRATMFLVRMLFIRNANKTDMTDLTFCSRSTMFLLLRCFTVFVRVNILNRSDTVFFRFFLFLFVFVLFVCFFHKYLLNFFLC